MSIEIRVPDIGDFDAVDVIEVLIKAGDTIEEEQSVLVLESDKASMEVPASSGGVVESVFVKAGDQVKEGDVIATLNARGDSVAVDEASQSPALKDIADTLSATMDLVVPDMGDFDSVNIIEVNVVIGQEVAVNDTLLTLETEKASMEMPSDVAGTIASITVKAGDAVSAGDVVGTIQTSDAFAKPAPSVTAETSVEAVMQTVSAAEKIEKPVSSVVSEASVFDEKSFSKAYASPAVRRFARELGVDLGRVSGTGRNQRILNDDVKAWVKSALNAKGTTAMATTEIGIPPIPVVDFSKFGEIEEQKLSRINVLTGEAMTRCWLNIPHVTQHDQCDITDLEEFRKSLKSEAEKRGVRVTMLAFLMKALVAGLKEFPRFNASLAPNGGSLILKKYYNIGIAVDTPNGLVVPVVRDVDKKGIYELSADLMELSKKARDGKLGPKDMSGASMTISSLGGIGGQYFTPIVNAPEVAILGVSRSTMQPVWNGKDFEPRLMLPLSMSYDHRVIDGALGARMTVYLGQLLSDMKKVLL